MRAELISDPICIVEVKAGIVKAYFSFKAIEPAGELVELSWEQGEPCENGKRPGGTSRCVVEDDLAPFVSELSIPLGLFFESARLKLRLRTLEPMRDIGYGKGRLTATAEDPAGTARISVTSWTDHA